jgi:creatinine amidohydrolase/Fe(II)-dependent formamide hydrolase-like protein
MALRSFKLEDLTWPEIREAMTRGVLSVVLPVGSTEQHGPHLPLATDSLHTVAIWRLSHRASRLCSPLSCPSAGLITTCRSPAPSP